MFCLFLDIDSVCFEFDNGLSLYIVVFNLVYEVVRVLL